MFARPGTRLALWAAALLGLACATNPVTGRRELALISEAQEIAIGQENYGPALQMQGGVYALDPGLVAYVREVGDRVAAVSDRAQLPYEFTVLNSSVPNAWAMPGGKIAVNRGLLVELESEAELAAILGHEVVHAAARHSARNMERGLLLQGAVLVASIALADREYGQLAATGANLAALLVGQKYGRDAEREADLYGTRYLHRAGYDPRAAVAVQETFVRLAEGRSPGWLEGLFASHPPSRERVAANRETVRALLSEAGEPGVLHAEAFRSRLAGLISRASLYAAHDRARRALAEGRTGEALALAQEALAGEPREASFHTLRGDVRLQQGRLRDAVLNYDRAIERDDGYFLPHLRRGQARGRLGQPREARADLERSLELLPTAPAHLELGGLAEARGDLEQAVRHYRAVASGDGEAGRAARGALARIDLPANPGAYLALAPLLAPDGFLAVQIENRAPIAVRDVAIAVVLLDANGWERARRELRLAGEIPGETRVAVRTDIGRFASAAELQRLDLRVLGARPVPDREAPR